MAYSAQIVGAAFPTLLTTEDTFLGKFHSCRLIRQLRGLKLSSLTVFSHDLFKIEPLHELARLLRVTVGLDFLLRHIARARPPPT